MIEVYVYSGPGVSRNSLEHTLSTFQAFSSQTLNPEQLLNDPWEKSAKLLIVPGGKDRDYVSSLGERGTQKIRCFVEEGGGYLGICAGSYFAGDYCEFAKGTDIAVCESRALSFFNGTVRGPILAPYSYESESGARVADLMCQNAFTACAYYNGGGTFVNAKAEHVLAYYAGEKRHPAIVSMPVGKGRAVLSGVHVEYDPSKLEMDHPLKKELSKGDVGRRRILEALFNLFRIKEG